MAKQTKLTPYQIEAITHCLKHDRSGVLDTETRNSLIKLLENAETVTVKAFVKTWANLPIE